jgi:hypothetical protein
MTIRFAAADRGASGFIARTFIASIPPRAANDNIDGISSDTLLRGALRHFAEHGLSAAERARENAESAFFAGDSEQYRWWLAICNALDRRMASAVAKRSTTAG